MTPDDPDVAALVKNTNNHITKNKMSLDSSLVDMFVLNLKGKIVFATDDKLLGKDKSKRNTSLISANILKTSKTKNS